MGPFFLAKKSQTIRPWLKNGTFFCERDRRSLRKNNRTRCYCGCSVSLSGAPSSWWIRAPLCQSCALVEQVFISLFSLSACLALCGLVTDEPCRREEHPVCSHQRWLPKALWDRITSQKRKFLWNLKGSGECVEPLTLAENLVRRDLMFQSVFRIKFDLLPCRDPTFSFLIPHLRVSDNTEYRSDTWALFFPTSKSECLTTRNSLRSFLCHETGDRWGTKSEINRPPWRYKCNWQWKHLIL